MSKFFSYIEIFVWCTKNESNDVSENLFLFWIFKTFYLSNDNSDLRSVFTTRPGSTRSLKLAPMLICFDNIFFGLKFINPFVRELSMVNVKNYQPHKLIWANFFLSHTLPNRYFILYQLNYVQFFSIYWNLSTHLFVISQW